MPCRRWPQKEEFQRNNHRGRKICIAQLKGRIGNLGVEMQRRLDDREALAKELRQANSRATTASEIAD